MPTFLMALLTGTSVDGSVMVYCGLLLKSPGRAAAPLLIRAGKIDRGGCGAARRRQQRLRDRDFDAFAVAGDAEIERRAAVELGGDAGGCDRVQIGLKHAIRIRQKTARSIRRRRLPNGV